MFCGRCGAPLSEHDRFCGRCGAAIDPAALEAQATAAKQAAAEKEAKRAYHLSTLSTAVTFGVMEEAIMLPPMLGVVLLMCSVVATWFMYGGQPIDEEPIFWAWIPDNWYELFIVLVVGYAVFYIIGAVIGLKVSGLIRRRVPAAPIEQRPLKLPELLMVTAIAFGLWGVGAAIGIAPLYVAPVASWDFGWNEAPIWVLSVLWAPVFEEYLFRKLLLDRVAPYGQRIAVLFSALLFGMAHQNGMQFYLAFGIGLLFAVIYLKTGRLRYTIALHCLINLFATLDSIGVLVFGDAFDIGWLIAAGVLTLAGVVTAVLCRHHPLFSLPKEESPAMWKAAFSGWSVTLVQVISIAAIAFMGFFYAALAWDADGGFESLLHLVPAGGAIAVICVLFHWARHRKTA